MSEFHYVRTMGVDGGVDACDGPAIGVDLESVLKGGLPPAKVALEIIASMCEILDIADEDGEVHGDVTPKAVFLDDTGAISIEGFGTARKSSRAPEGDPIGTATDLYGLGFTAFRLLGGKVEPSKTDPDKHDDTVIDAIVGLGFGDVPEEFHGDIQWFLAKLMGFEPDDRPPAVDAWRTFVAFADETDGTRLEDWAAEAIEGRGERRDASTTAAKPPPSDPSEDLGGPTKSKGPLAKGAIDFSAGGGGKAASATAFWSKDALKGALAASDPTDEEPAAGEAPEATPFGGGYQPKAAASTSFWSKDQLEAERGPKRGGGAPNRPPRATPPAGPGGPPAGPPGKPPGGPPPGGPSGGRPPGGEAPPQGQSPWAAQPQGVQGGQAPPPMAPSGYPPVVPAAPAEEAGGGEDGGGIVFGGVVVVIFLVLCLGGGALAAAAYYMSSSGSSTSTDIEEDEEDEDEEAKDEEDEDAPKKDTGGAAEEPKPAPATVGPKPAPTTTAPKPKPAPTTTTAPKPAPTTTSTRPAPAPTTSTRPAPAPAPSGAVRPGSAPKPAPAPAPAPAGGKASVTFNVGSRGTIGCSDGQSIAVDGTKTAEFESYQLPVSCMITVDGGGRWAGLISGGGTIRCSGAGSAFNCTGP